MINRTIIVFVALISPFCLSAQEDKEVRQQAYLSVLLEDLHTAQYYTKRISKPTGEDKWLQLETELLRDPSAVVSIPDRLDKTHTPYFFYLVALSDFQHRKFKDALETVSNAKYASASNALRGKVEFLKGKALVNLNQADQAQTHLFKALTLFRTDSSTCYIQIAKVYNFLGRTFDVQGQPDVAIAHYQHALYILDNCPLEKVDDRARIMNNLAIAYKNEGDYLNGQAQYLKTVSFRETHASDSASLVGTYINFGIFYTDFGNYFRSQQYYDKARQLIDTTQEKSYPQLAEYYNNYGLLLIKMREFERAISSFKQSLAFHAKANSQPYKSIKPGINLADCLNNADHPQEAINVLITYDSIISTLPANSIDRVLYWMARGSIALDIQPDSAWQYFWHAKETLEQFPKIPERRYTDVLISLGIAADIAGKSAVAMDYYKQALTRLRSGAMEKEKLITLYINLGMGFGENKLYDSARYHFRLALQENQLEYNERTGTQPFVAAFELITTHYNLVRLDLLSFQKSKDIKDLLNALPSAEVGLQLIRIERERMILSADKIDFGSDVSLLYSAAAMVYYHLYKQTGKHEYYERLFEVTEWSRQQVMMSSLRIDKIDAFAGVTHRVMEREKSIGYAIKHLTSQLSSELALGEEATGELVQEYTHSLELEKHKLEYLTDSLKNNLPDYYNLKYNKTVASLADIQQDVLSDAPQRALIQYFVADSALLIIVQHSNRKAVIQIPYSGIAKHITALRNHIQYKLPAWRTPAAWLYERLLKPVDSVLAGLHPSVRELIIIPDRELVYLPFETLVPNATTRLLIERMEVTYAFSSTLLWQKATDRSLKIGNQKFIGFAPTFEQDGAPTQYPMRAGEELISFTPLPATPLEVKQITALLNKKGIATQTLEGDQASEASFKLSSLKEYRYIHLATHGFVNMEDPDRSGIAFSKVDAGEDGILFSSEVYGVRLNAELVCLSACETGLGKIYRGEGLIGLSRSFLYAGARNLVVSLWSVEDKSTSEWMTEFYTILAKGERNAFAVRKAKLELLKSKNYRHPYFWAPFILIGS